MKLDFVINCVKHGDTLYYHYKFTFYLKLLFLQRYEKENSFATQSFQKLSASNQKAVDIKYFAANDIASHAILWMTSFYE